MLGIVSAVAGSPEVGSGQDGQAAAERGQQSATMTPRIEIVGDMAVDHSLEPIAKRRRGFSRSMRETTQSGGRDTPLLSPSSTAHPRPQQRFSWVPSSSSFNWRYASARSPAYSPTQSSDGPPPLSSSNPISSWSFRDSIRLTSDASDDRHFQLLEEKQKREESERVVAKLQEDVEQLQEQNELLIRETRCLQSDNSVLVRHLQDQSLSLASLSFDAERFKSCLELHSIEAPQSLYSEILVRARIPGLQLQSGSLPDELLHAAELTAEEKANFSSIEALVSTVSELQVRLRDSRVSKLSIADERVAELKNEVDQIEKLYDDVKRSKELMQQQLEEEVRAAIKKNDLLNGKLVSKDAEIEELLRLLGELKTKDLERMEKERIVELEQRIASFTSAAEEWNTEIARLRAENSSLTAASVVNLKELEYHQLSLSREREQCDSLRAERNSLYDELNSARTVAAQHSTEKVLLESRVSLLERTAKAREDEVEEWRQRLSEAQQKMVEEQSRWDRSLQEQVSKLSRLEMTLEEAYERVDLLNSRIREKDREFVESKESYLVTVREREGEIQIVKNSLLAETIAREAANQKIKQLKEQLQVTNDERQILIRQLENVESQASILKHRHPQLDFGVMEDELRLFEAERVGLLNTAVDLRKQLEVSSTAAESRENLLQQLNASIDSQKSIIVRRDEELKETKQALSHLKEKLEEGEKVAAQALEETSVVVKELTEVKKALAEKEHSNKQMTTEIEVSRKSESEKWNRMQQELEQTKRELSKAQLDVESVSQGHRLEIQAHARDLSRLEFIQRAHQTDKEQFDQELERLQDRLRQAESKILTLASELSDARRKSEVAESQRLQVLVENEGIRRLLHDKLDSLELAEDDQHGVKAQLAERLRIEESLKREADKSRVECERLQLELKSTQSELQQYRLKVTHAAAQMEKLEEEKGKLGSSPSEDSRSHLLGDLLCRASRLENELQLATELKRSAERRYQSLLDEVEPIRRREAALLGEVASMKSLLETTERDVLGYKLKYLESTRGMHQDLEVQKGVLEARIKESETKQQELEAALSQTNQNLVVANTENATLKNEVEKLSKDSSQLKVLLQSTQSQLETLQSQRPKIDNVDIQKKYQVQLSHVQRLVQQGNAEKEKLRLDLTASSAALATKTAHAESLEKQLQQLQREYSTVMARESSTPSGELLVSLGGILDEAVRVGTLSCLVAQRSMVPSTTHPDVPAVEKQHVLLSSASCFSSSSDSFIKTVDTSSPKHCPPPQVLPPTEHPTLSHTDPSSSSASSPTGDGTLVLRLVQLSGDSPVKPISATISPDTVRQQFPPDESKGLSAGEGTGTDGEQHQEACTTPATASTGHPSGHPASSVAPSSSLQQPQALQPSSSGDTMMVDVGVTPSVHPHEQL